MERFLRQRYAAHPTVFSRMVACLFMQGWYNAVCDAPASTLLTGKTVLITGATAGIGYETAKELCERGAFVIIASRSVTKLEEVRLKLTAGCKNGGSIEAMVLDLGDLNNVVEFTKQFAEKYPNRKVDILIENAGLWPRAHSLSPQGFEASIATNLLGHFVLRSRLHENKILVSNARIVVVTGDIYIKASDCTLNYDYTGEGEMAYCRSKLGVHWLFDEFHKSFPSYEMIIVHPGVIRTELAVDNAALFGSAGLLKSLILLDERAGCQTTLIAAVAPSSKIVNGGYYHNCCGLMQLSAEDPVKDTSKAQVLCDAVKLVAKPFIEAK